jgi:segregation and condensation protein B
MVKNTIKTTKKEKKDDSKERVPVKKENVRDTSKKNIKPPVQQKQIKERAAPKEKRYDPIEDIVTAMAEKEPEKDPTTEIKSLEQLKEKIMEKLEGQSEHARIEPEQQEQPVKNPVAEKISKEDPSIENKSRVEAVLFAIGKYVDDELISQLCELDKRSTRKALEELKKDYDDKDGALIVFQEGNSWKINVREKYLSLVRKIVADTELSKSVMETLAVIAWKTPVYQSEVVRIRGNKCYDHIEELENSGFITKDKKGRSYVLKTTEKFYNYFDIEQKNLKGVMNEAKMPTQTTLAEADEPEEIVDPKEKLLKTLETIETKSIVYTQEDKNAQDEFLEKMNQKIVDTSKRTDEYTADIPRPMHEQAEVPQVPLEAVMDQPPEITDTGAVKIKDEEDIVINTDIGDSHHEFQKAEAQPQKPKTLTKKQLEKKFREDLLKARERIEKKLEGKK